METFKQCTVCGREFPATTEYFPPNKDGKFGLYSRCRECKRVHDDRWRGENIGKVKEAGRAASARWREKNPEKARELSRQSEARRRRENPERGRVAVRKSLARLRQDRPEEYREARRVQDARRKAREKGLPNSLTRKQWQYALDWWDGCAYCGADVGKQNLTLDHVIPLASPDCPGTTADNCLPACTSCNFSKNVFSLHEFLERNFGHIHAAKRLAIIAVYFSTLQQ